MKIASALQAPPALSDFLEQGPVALFLDFDGTLVEIANRPDAIIVPTTLGLRLENLDERLGGRVALVSGRSIEDLDLYLGELKVIRAGSHGIDLRGADGTHLSASAISLPTEAMEDVARFALENPAILIEKKPHGTALHYRASPQLEGVVTTFASALAERFSLRLIRGKCVVELVRSEAGKANAVRVLMAAPGFAGALPVFIGDDVTDEDGFCAVEEMGGVGILVGDRADTRARYRLRDPQEVHEWLTL